MGKIILSEKCLSDVWIIHGLTHKKNNISSILPPISPISLSPSSTMINTKNNSNKNSKQNKKQHTRASSYSFSAGTSSKNRKKKINIMGGRNKKRRQSTTPNNNSKNRDRFLQRKYL